jgi:hypothetical protein
VTGTNFIPASTVELGGVAAATTYVSSTQLTFQLSVAQEATTQDLLVGVMNPTPGGGTTLGAELEITPQMPTPVITQVQPTDFYVQSGESTITVYGTNLFPVSSSIVYSNQIGSVLWNGTALTTYGFCTGCGGVGQSVTATVPGNLLASAGRRASR